MIRKRKQTFCKLSFLFSVLKQVKLTNKVGSMAEVKMEVSGT